ncbi:MAG: tetratricopeptide repeat protein [Bacteroidetes bacterium]|nr:tetratricopeptide repeat protein [Bacteroidota bacterium]
MRKIIILPLLLVFATAFSQKASVQSAADLLKLKEYVKAKAFIDEAAVYESTSNDPKMWYYRGKVYQAVNDDKELSKTNPEAAYIATQSFINCIHTDKKENHKDSTDIFTWIAGYSLYNRAVEQYQAGNMEVAMKFYKEVQEVFPYDKDNNMKRNNITSDIVTKNLYLCSYRLNDFTNAKMYLQKLIDVKFNDPSIYLGMCKILLQEKDTAKALSYVEMGRTTFEEHPGLIGQEISIYVAQGKTKELIDKVSLAIETDTENERLYNMRGSLNEKTNNLDKAIPDYKKALELKEDYMEVNYNLGNLLFGQAADLSTAANAIKDNNEFAKAKEKIDQKLKEAQPYLERTKELNQKKTDDDKLIYQTTQNLLKQLYARTNQMDKYNEVKAEMEK